MERPQPCGNVSQPYGRECPGYGIEIPVRGYAVYDGFRLVPVCIKVINRLPENTAADTGLTAARRAYDKADFPLHVLDREFGRALPVATVFGIEKTFYPRSPVAIEITATVFYLDSHTVTTLRVRPSARRRS